MIELFYRLKMWYMINVQKIDYFIIGVFTCDALNIVVHYEPNLFGYLVWDLTFLVLFIFLKWKESNE